MIGPRLSNPIGTNPNNLAVYSHWNLRILQQLIWNAQCRDTVKKADPVKKLDSSRHRSSEWNGH